MYLDINFQRVIVFIVLVTGVRSIFDVDGDPKRCKFFSRMKQHLWHDGFHRNLSYYAIFKTFESSDVDPWWFGDCLVAIEQELPPSVYVNPDELRELRRLGKLNAFVDGPVDIEAAMEESKTTYAYVMGEVHGMEILLWLPIHSKYHRPKRNEPHALVTLPLQTMYLKCPDNRLERCGIPRTSRSKAICRDYQDGKCPWKRIGYTKLSPHIQFLAPVGNVKQILAVTCGTVVVVFFGSLVIIRAMDKFKNMLVKKTA